MGDGGEQWWRVGGYGCALRLSAVDGCDERDLIGTRVEGNVDDQERPGREAEHADGVRSEAEPLRFGPDDLDGSAAVVGAGDSGPVGRSPWR